MQTFRKNKWNEIKYARKWAIDWESHLRRNVKITFYDMIRLCSEKLFSYNVIVNSEEENDFHILIWDDH